MLVLLWICITICTVYILILIYSVFMKTDPCKSVLFSVAFIIASAVISYFYVPREYGDLYLHLLTIRKLIGSTPAVQWDYLQSDPLLLRSLYFILISKLGNEHLVKPCTTIVFYGIVFSNLYYLRKKMGYSSVESGIYLLSVLSLFGFCSIWGSIRMPLSLAICSYAMTRIADRTMPTVQKWILIFVCFLCAALMHVGAIIPILCFAAYKLFKNSRIIKLILLSFSLCINMISSVLQKMSSQYALLMNSKVDVYFNENMYHIAYRLYIPEILFLIVITYVLLVRVKFSTNKKNYDNISYLPPSYYEYLELVVAFTWGSILYNQIFNREIYYLALMSFPAWASCRISKNRMRFSVAEVALLLICILFVSYNITILNGAYRLDI